MRKGRWRGSNAPDAEEEHEPTHNLSLPRQTQPHELRERQSEHPDVKCDTRRGRHPGEDVVVPAVAVMQALPLHPEVGEGLALEDDSEEEGEVVDEVEHHGADQETVEPLVLLGWEDAYVEEQDGGAEEESAERVDEHVAKEHLEEGECASNFMRRGTYPHDRGNVIERDEPHILALPQLDACRE